MNIPLVEGKEWVVHRLRSVFDPWSNAHNFLELISFAAIPTDNSTRCWMKWSGMCAYTRRQEKTFSYRTASVTCALPAIGFQLIHQQRGWVNVQTGCVTAPLSKVQKK